MAPWPPIAPMPSSGRSICASTPSPRRAASTTSAPSRSTLVLIWALATQNWWWLLAVPVFGYGFAWFSHFFIEKNKPATFQAPFWSLISDYRMCGLWLSGRLGNELMKYQIRD